jgi:CRP/FNR family transcriptional regulator
VELLRLLDVGKVPHMVASGRLLFDEGAPPFAVHCIRMGRVKLFKSGPGGEEQIIRILGSGDLVGYRAVLAGEPYAATAQALDDTTVCTIPARVLIELIRKSPDFALEVLAKVARELRISEETLVSLSRKSIRQRLAAVLILLSDSRPAAPLPRCPGTVRLARRDLAQLIATSPESISRALHRFATEGSVECSRKEIRLLDLPALRRAAGADPFSDLDSDQFAS